MALALFTLNGKFPSQHQGLRSEQTMTTKLFKAHAPKESKADQINSVRGCSNRK